MMYTILYTIPLQDINLDYFGYGLYGILLLAFTLWALMNADTYGNKY